MLLEMNCIEQILPVFVSVNEKLAPFSNCNVKLKVSSFYYNDDEGHFSRHMTTPLLLVLA